MDLAPYVDRLRNDLADAAAAGGPQATEAAQRLALALDPAVRMTLMEALSDAAAEITAELHTAAWPGARVHRPPGTGRGCARPDCTDTARASDAAVTRPRGSRPGRRG